MKTPCYVNAAFFRLLSISSIKAFPKIITNNFNNKA